MAATESLIILLFCFIFRDAQSQICSTDEECGDDQICGVSPKECFSRFNATDYESFSWKTGSSPLGGANVASYDTTLLLDGNTSTGVTIPAFEFNWIELVFPGTQGYWVHEMVFVFELISAAAGTSINTFDVYINGYGDKLDKTDFEDDSNAIDDGNIHYIAASNALTYPFFMKNISIRIVDFIFATTFYSIDIYGANNSPVPTESPSTSPTEQTEQPSTSPTPAPTDDPTPAPTPYPTPNVCDEFMVTQSCCGNYGYIPTSDKINLRDPSLATCEYTFGAQCCGTTGGFQYSANNFYGCDGDFGLTVCLPEYWDSAINTTDDIFGPIVNVTTDFLDIINADPRVITDTQLINDINFCQCNWTVYECEGEDVAVCGTQSDYADLFDLECWNNQWDNETYSPADLVNLNLTQEECWTDNEDDFAYLLYEPCSKQSFLGAVTNIERMAIPDESILDDDCSCSYFVTNCRILEDKTTLGTSAEEVANPCCTTQFDYEYRNFTRNGVNATLTATLDDGGIPSEDGWTCSNGLELCPDLWNRSRKYDFENRVDWWYDDSEFYSICGCKYIVDQVNLPSHDPTMDPTADPTEIPTFEPTESQGDGAFEIKISFTVIIMVILSMISLL